MKKINLRKLTLKAFKRLPASEKRITIPTLFTLARIGLTPLIVLSMIASCWGCAFFFFVSASITDVIDGLLARYLNEKTFLGACLDPIADKLLLLSCFTTLAFVDTPSFHIPCWFVLFVVSKEVIHIAGATFIYVVKGHLDVRPTVLGKMTTFIQMGFIIWLFACYFFHWVPVKTYYTMLGMVLLFIVVSFGQYVRIGVRMLRVGSIKG
jgi:cardiolipin synthase (CMP-forming)